MTVSLAEWEALWFFGVEPTSLDPDVPWVYDENTYQVRKIDFEATFVLVPSSHELSFRIIQNTACLFDFELRGLKDIRLEKVENKERLVIDLGKGEYGDLSISLTPKLELIQSIHGSVVL